MQIIDSSQKDSICRPLGAWEKNMFWSGDQNHHAQFAMMAQIKGEFSVEQLEQALSQVQNRHLLLRVCIALDEAQQPWFEEDQGSANIPLRVVPREGEQHWEKELKQELSVPFVSLEDSLVRIVLIYSTDISELIILSHHSISDGMSKSFLIRDILQALAEPEDIDILKSLPIIPAQEDLIPTKVDENLLSVNSRPQKTFWRQKSSLSTKLTAPPVHVSTAKDGQTSVSQTIPDIHFASLSPENTDLLISRCRQEKTTVHAAICSAFLLAIAKRRSSEKQQAFRCFTAVDIRKHLRPVVEEQFGYYAHIGSILQTLTPNTTLWDLARSLKDQLNQELAPEKLFEDLLRNQELVSTNPDFTQIRQQISEYLDKGITISNLGRVKFSPQFGHLQLQAIYGPIGIPPGVDVSALGAITLGNQLFLTLVLPKSLMHLKEDKELIEELMNLLITLIQQRQPV